MTRVSQSDSVVRVGLNGPLQVCNSDSVQMEPNTLSELREEFYYRPKTTDLTAKSSQDEPAQGLELVPLVHCQS